MSFDLAEMCITDVELTPPNDGESLRHHIQGEAEVLLADRGYAKRAQIGAALSAGADVIAGIHYMTVPLENSKGRPLQTLSLLETLASHEIGDWPVYMRHGNRRFPVRLVAVKKSREAAGRAVEKAKRKASKNDSTKPDPKSLTAARYTYVLTNLSPEKLSAAEVLELYRLRWQIELAFKRIKSLLQLSLRVKDEDLARTYLLANILGALLIEELSGDALSFFPWGFRLVKAPS
jgi:hypothetical protein